MADDFSPEFRQFQNFTNNLRSTALGVRFARQLYTNPGGLSPQTITEVMRTLGMPIPKEITIAAEVAQMICAGQAAVAAYNAGQSLGQVSNPSIAAVSACISLFKAMGWLKDENGDVATTTSLVTNVALLISSFGCNIGAWIGLAMTAYADRLANEAKATQQAAKVLQGALTTRLNREQLAMSQNFMDFNEGRLGLLGFMAKNAYQAPELFVKAFKNNPELIKKLPEGLRGLTAMPTYQYTISATGESHSTFLGAGNFNGSTKTISFSMDSIGAFTSEDQVREYFFYYLIEPNLYSYYIAQQNVTEGRLSLETLALAYAMGAPVGFIEPNKDYSWIFDYLSLTPAEFGENFVNQYIQEEPSPVAKAMKELGVDFSGMRAVAQTPAPTAREELYANRELAMKLNDLGYAKQLMGIPLIQNLVSNASRYPQIPYNKIYQSYNESYIYTDRAGKIQQGFLGYGGWRKLQNYLSALEYLDMVYKDPYYFKWENERLKKYEFLRSLDSFQAKFKELNTLSLVRGMNQLAQGNVAGFLGTTPDQLVRKNNLTETGPGYYTIK